MQKQKKVSKNVIFLANFLHIWWNNIIFATDKSRKRVRLNFRISVKIYKSLII